MPVVFEQPDPVGFESAQAQAGGYVAQYNANRQYALQAAALQQHAQQANQQAQLQSRLGTAQIQQQGQALAARGQVSPAEQFQAHQQQQAQAQQFAQQQALLAQRGQQQQQMGQQEAQQAPVVFSQGDYMNLQRLQGGMSQIDKLAASGEYTPEEAAQLKQQIQPQIQALQQKQIAFRRQQRGQATTENVQDAAAHAATVLSGDIQMAKGAGTTDGTNRIYDKDGHTIGVVMGGKFNHITGAAAASIKESPEHLENQQQIQDGKDYTEMFKAMATKGADGGEKAADPESVKAALYQRRLFVQAGIDARKAAKQGIPPPNEEKSEGVLLPRMADPKAEAAAYQARYEGKAVPAEVLMRLRELRAAIQAQQTPPPQAPPPAQAATREQPQPGFMDTLRGYLPSTGNIGGVGRDPRYR